MEKIFKEKKKHFMMELLKKQCKIIKLKIINLILENYKINAKESLKIIKMKKFILIWQKKIFK